MTIHTHSLASKRLVAKTFGMIALTSSAMMIAPSVIAKEVTAELKGVDGGTLGEITFIEVSTGVQIKANLQGMSSGAHAFHIHETGKCNAADGFESAGGHLAAGKEHGFLEDKGPHAGDMPNVHIPESGELTIEVLNTSISMGSEGSAALNDVDGSALLLHADADDYKSQPSGDAAARIACAIIAEPSS
ncbi:superoxide dismutase family protein [Granulosicoccus antarcticus]|uniref:Superoxide dismutase (Cu-Zn) n=1 Tax=Granulosicoccus antarcticus IMCC3135 TaxID=1192854 RepID=A0A2Z2NYP9_9GAMM|nr:superoxide dismutase family protein [Granulosicoccus antarcticus]ASJ73980.1 Superoxide dismutase (Cu-Zn) [Granulosicoccus antarcticus IMCC3135]